MDTGKSYVDVNKQGVKNLQKNKKNHYLIEVKNQTPNRKIR